MSAIAGARPLVRDAGVETATSPRRPARFRRLDLSWLGLIPFGAYLAIFLALPTVAARQAAITYAQRHGILSIGDAKGFAEQGGIIQITFVEQNVQIKINYDAAVKTGLHIGAPLLSIATVLRRSQP